jgi:SSS family solute:Na+ symporter
MNEFIASVILYAILGTIIALYAQRGLRSQEDYFIGGRRIGGIISALTYAATTYSAFMMVGLVGLSYKTGVGAAGFELMYLVGTLFLLSYYAPKVWKLGKELGLVSPAELLAYRYGANVAKLATILALIALIPYTSIQMIGVALILQNNAGISFASGVAVASILIALWAFLGGLRGIAWTDAIQGVFMLSVAVLATIWTFNYIGSFEIPKGLARVPNEFWTPVRFATLTLPWFFFALTNPQVFQRLFIPKDERAIKKMVVLFGFFGLVYTILVTFLGLELRFGTEIGRFPLVEDRDKVTPTLLSIMPKWLALPLALSILAAAITTANSIVLTLSSMVLRDVIGEKAKIFGGKIVVVALTVMTALFALHRVSYIVELAVLSSTILLCQLPLIFGVFHWKKGGALTGIATLACGFTTAIALSLMKHPLVSIVTFCVSFAVFFILSVIEKGENQPKSL